MQMIHKFNTSLVTVLMDTIWLVATLTEEQKEQIKDTFQCFSNPDKFKYYYTHVNKALGLTILITPVNHASHYNTCIKLQHKLISQPLPDSIRELIYTYNWMIRRTDIAFDTALPMKQSYSVSRHGNVKNWNPDEWETSNYNGDIRKKWDSISIHYDRNEKEQNDKYQTGIVHEKFNRYEIRFRPTVTEEEGIYLHNMTEQNHARIMEELDKYKFIPDISKVNPSTYRTRDKLIKDKNIIKRISRDYERRKEETTSDMARVTKMINANRLPTGDLYQQNIAELFKYLTESTLILTPIYT